MRGMTASFVALALAAVGFTGCQREHVVAEPDYNRQLTSGHALRKLEQAGCVVLVDDTALRAPSCPCCK